MNERPTRVHHSKLCLVLPATPSTYIFPHHQRDDRLKVAEQVLIPDDFLVSKLRLGIRIERFIDPDPYFCIPTCIFVFTFSETRSERYESDDAKRATKMQIDEKREASEQALSGLHTVETLLRIHVLTSRWKCVLIGTRMYQATICVDTGISIPYESIRVLCLGMITFIE